jgi:hypothetical protein
MVLTITNGWTPVKYNDKVCDVNSKQSLKYAMPLPVPGDPGDSQTAFGPLAKVGLWVLEKKVLKGARFTFPQNWSKEFHRQLWGSPGAQRLFAPEFQNCDLRKVGKAAMLYIRSPHWCFRIDRESRAKQQMSQLHKDARTLKSEIQALSEARSRNLIALPDQSISNREVRLKEIEAELARYRCLALSARRQGRKREGDSGDHAWLFLIREYLAYKSGGQITGAELALIVKAGRAALNYRIEYRQVGVGGNTILRRLQRFEKNNPEFCFCARQPKVLQPVYYPWSAYVIESLP